MVDDEAVARTLLEYHLKKAGHRAIVADCAATARRLVGELGPAAIDCVVTDYNMPGESGLELLLWLKQTDPTLSVIMVTATTERETVAATLRGGASDFLDKPITEARLTPALAGSIAATAQRRRLAETDRAVQAVGKAQHQMFGLGPEAAAHLTVCYHPCHAAGGDFVNYFPLSPGKFLVLTGDVSGHDLNAAFVSAYFQGMVRGMIEAGQPVARVLESFNRFLLKEWGEDSAAGIQANPLSVCACVVTVDQTRGAVSLSNHGIPQTCQIDASGRMGSRLDCIAGPLGWFSDLAGAPAEFFTPEGGQLLVWTDGLEDLAQALDVSPGALATALLRARQQGETRPELAVAKDDVLVVSIQLAGAPAGPAWRPILHEHYPGDQGPAIDQLQSRWERSLQLALPDLPDSRRYDVLLALRETVINALKHGCGGRADQRATLMLTVQPEQRIVRGIISDSGPGHDYDWAAQPPPDELADLHRGLSLINRLATVVTTARHGAELLLDFHY